VRQGIDTHPSMYAQYSLSTVYTAWVVSVMESLLFLAFNPLDALVHKNQFDNRFSLKNSLDSDLGACENAVKVATAEIEGNPGPLSSQ